MCPFRILCASVAFCSSSVLLLAQLPSRPAFEVASIKASAPLAILMGQIRSRQVIPGMTVIGNRFDFAFGLDRLIAAAYRIEDRQIPYQIVGPDWLSSQRFEIHATIPEGTSQERVPEMIQTLLEERFKFKSHFENREQDVYALAVPKDGPGVTSADDISAASFADAVPFSSNGEIRMKREGDSTIMIDQRTGMISRMWRPSNGTRRTDILRTSMAAFIEYIALYVDHPIIDETNLEGFYKITLEMSLDVMLESVKRRATPMDLTQLVTPFSDPSASTRATGSPASTAPDPAGRSMLQVVQKAGFKLEPRKAPMRALIIDHVEKNPTEN